MRIGIGLLVFAGLFFISLTLGIINTDEYIKSAKTAASESVVNAVERRGEKVCYVGTADYSMGSIELSVESDEAAYYFVVSSVNHWVNFTFLNYFISPVVKIQVEHVMEKSHCK